MDKHKKIIICAMTWKMVKCLVPSYTCKFSVIWVEHTEDRFSNWYKLNECLPQSSLRKNESKRHSVMSDSSQSHGLYRPWNSPGQNTGVGSLSLLQGIFPTQGLKPGLLPYRWTLYQLSHKGSPRMLEWVGYPFSISSSQPRNQTGVSLHCRQILYQLSW